MHRQRHTQQKNEPIYRTIMIPKDSKECQKTLIGHNKPIKSVQWNPGGTMVASASYDHDIKIWNIETEKNPKTLKDHTHGVYSIRWKKPDGTKILSASADKTIKIWDIETGKCELTLTGHADGVKFADWILNNTQIISASYDSTIKIWCANTGKCLKTLNGHNKAVHSAQLNFDNTKILSTGEDKSLIIWDFKNGTILSNIQNGHTQSIYSTQWNPKKKNEFLTVAEDNTIKIWDDSGNLLQTIKENLLYFACAVFNHSGNQIATGAPFPDATVRIWDRATKKCLKTFVGHTTGVSSVDWNHDETKLVSSAGTEIRIWDATT